MLEFAIAWPVCLLLVAGAIQLSVWSAESQAVRQAALAGARSGTAVGAGADVAAAVTMAALGRSLIGAQPRRWCPVEGGPEPAVWVCTGSTVTFVEVRVGGRVPALLPLLPGGSGLPVAAHAVIAREAFRP